MPIDGIPIFVIFITTARLLFAMRIFSKNNNKIVELGEGRIFSKSQIKLNEEVEANLGMANGVRDAQMKAKEMMSKNSNVGAASTDAGKLDGYTDRSNGEGMKLQLPIDANGSEISQAQQMVRNHANNDMEIEFTKQDKIQEMRNNSIPFTKKELSEFLNNL